MLFKKIKPICPSLRNKMVVSRYRSKVFKKLCFSYKRSQGRDLNGSIISYGKGGGSGLFKYRYVDFSLNFFNIPYIFLGYDFDNYRTGWVGLIKYLNGSYSYILAPAHLTVGCVINSTNSVSKNIVGSKVQLKSLEVGTWVYGVESIKNQHMIYARAAGARCFVKAQDFLTNITVIRLPSRKVLKLNGDTYAYIGQVSNEMHYFEHYSKAGVGKIFNYRPSVRGEAMNAVDHHHGGKTKGGKKPKTPWGKIIKK